ncbi:hypothetical protein BgiMline_002268, partial [Biomphalaria glabrata]
VYLAKNGRLKITLQRTMNSLRSTINSLQTLKMIDLKGEQETVGHEDNKSEVEKVSRNKRGYSNYISASEASSYCKEIKSYCSAPGPA